MYVIVIIALAVVIAIGAAWSPIFALIIAVPLFALFLAFVGFSRRADEKVSVPTASGGGSTSSEVENTEGIWGEKRPEG